MSGGLGSSNVPVGCELARAALLGLILLAGTCPRSEGLESGPAGRPSAAPDYDWSLPPGFPEPRVPADNPMTTAKVELGRYLFYDRRLSGNGAFSCAGCHRQGLAFTDGRARASGTTGELHPRSAMSLTNVAYNATFDWASAHVRSLEDQMQVPMFSETPVELGMRGREAEVLDRLRGDARYWIMFDEAFPDESDPISFATVTRAIASFERTLISGNSAYDRWLYWDERDALSEPARRGMRLFFSERTRCSNCHAGFTFGGPVVSTEEVREPAFHNTNLYNLDLEGSYPLGNRGLFEHSRASDDMGRFRAPTLRNVALTAPYMHDGSVATLEEAIDHYAKGGRARPINPYRSGEVEGFEMSTEEREELVAFLQSLTDRGFVENPRLSDPFAEQPSQRPD